MSFNVNKKSFNNINITSKNFNVVNELLNLNLNNKLLSTLFTTNKISNIVTISATSQNICCVNCAIYLIFYL